MAALKTGDYSTVFFDRYGNRLKNVRHIHSTNLCQAITKSRRYARLCGHETYRIDRAIYNSLDPHHKT